MEPLLDDQQTQIRDSATRLCQDFAGPARMRRARDGFDAAAWQQVAAAGWPLLLVPEADAGLGMGLLELALVMEACGQQLLQAPVLATCAATYALARAGQPGPLQAAVDRAERLVPLLIDETDLYAAGCRLPVATAAGNGCTLAGEVPAVPAAGLAQAFLVPARDGAGGTLLALVRADAPGLALVPQACIDGSRADTLRFDGVAVPAASVLARGAAADALSDDIATILCVGTGAELIGVAHAALALALEHLKTRKQFGKPLASFQALQHQCVNCFLDIELNRSLLYRTSAAWTRGQAHPAMVSALKSRTSRAALAATRAAVQLHGAMGYTEAHDIGLYYKRAVVLAARYGNENHHAARFSALTLGTGGNEHA